MTDLRMAKSCVSCACHYYRCAQHSHTARSSIYSRAMLQEIRRHEMDGVPKCCPSDPAQKVLSPFTHQHQPILNLNVMTLLRDIFRPFLHTSWISTSLGLIIYAVSCWSRPQWGVPISLNCPVQEVGTILRLEKQQQPSASRIHDRPKW